MCTDVKSLKTDGNAISVCGARGVVLIDIDKVGINAKL